ncbi:rhomboid-related protein 2 isoform X2 [Folsomia candida]|nr:rhomboid-related protein 2 isoform X2 [Folsomia candida]
MHESPLRVQNLDESPSNKRRRRATGGSLTPSTSQLVELDNLPWLSDPNLDAIQPPLSFKERTVAWLSRNLEDKHVPIFIPSVSLLQIGLYYSVGFDKLLLPFGIDPYRRYEIWRYVTILLVHNTPLHLWVNIIGQLIVGTLLEISYNWVKVCAIYLTSVVGGSLSITIFSSLVYASGASAGQYGLLFGHVSALILNWHTARWRRLRLFLLILYLILDIGLAPVLQQL